MYKPIRPSQLLSGLTLLLLIWGTALLKPVPPTLTAAPWLAEIEASCFNPQRMLQQRLKLPPKLAPGELNGNHLTPLDFVPVPPNFEPPPLVKGVYLSSGLAGNSRVVQRLLDFATQSQVNAVVIDIKDDSGKLSYPSRVALAQEIGSSSWKFHPQRLLKIMNQQQLYPIARIVVFKDPYLAGKRPDLAVLSTQGGTWQDFTGQSWVDPYNKTVWEYNVALAKEAAQLGFREIQFDYVRFTSDGVLQYCKYPGADGRSRAAVIRDFLKYAYKELHPLGVKVSADVFGLVCSNSGDLGIGQNLEMVAEGVDIICPMVYPSHYRNGTYDLTNPDSQPYETIYRSLSDAQRRLAALKLDHPVLLRPWLQDFSLRQRYDQPQIQAQIRAVQDVGLQEWLFWNPWASYDQRKFAPEISTALNRGTKPDLSR